MRPMLALLVALFAVPVLADEKEAAAALETAGVVLSRSSNGNWSVAATSSKPGSNISEEKAKRLAELRITSIRHSVIGTNDKVLPVIVKLPHVLQIVLDGKATDADVKEISAMSSLTHVVLLSDEITDKGLLALSKVAGLTEVRADSRKVTQAGKEKLNELLPKCVVKGN